MFSFGLTDTKSSKENLVLIESRLSTQQQAAIFSRKEVFLDSEERSISRHQGLTTILRHPDD
jgi:hypothetical protein